jgi:hypothetical protein
MVTIVGYVLVFSSQVNSVLVPKAIKHSVLVTVSPGTYKVVVAVGTVQMIDVVSVVVLATLVTLVLVTTNA